jgi:hypothetical protein
MERGAEERDGAWHFRLSERVPRDTRKSRELEGLAVFVRRVIEEGPEPRPADLRGGVGDGLNDSLQRDLGCEDPARLVQQLQYPGLVAQRLLDGLVDCDFCARSRDVQRLALLVAERLRLARNPMDAAIRPDHPVLHVEVGAVASALRDTFGHGRAIAGVNGFDERFNARMRSRSPASAI